MIALPTEIQLIILRQIVPVPGPSDWYYSSLFSVSTVQCVKLAAAFLAAHIAAPAPSLAPLVGSCIDVEQRRIDDIRNPVILRIALARALPEWRGSLRGIPSLWNCIVVPVGERTWGVEVLDAVQDAAVCAREELLHIMITREPFENERKGAGEEEGDPACLSETVEKDDVDGGNIERARISQIIALLAPHMARWRHLHVRTVHSVALPVPAIDFAGDASMLRELRLSAIIPLPTAMLATAPWAARALNVSNLTMVTMDARVFCAAFLSQPDALCEVRTLTLCGPRVEGWGGSPAVSARKLLACVAHMLNLRALTLDNVHLRVERNGQGDGTFGTTASTMLMCNPTLYCVHLSAPVLGEVLDLAIPANDEVTAHGDFRGLHISECSLPRSPPLEHYGRIELHHIPEGEDIGPFLEHAARSLVLDVSDCPSFSIAALARPAASAPWLLPFLLHLTVTGCRGVELEGMLEMMRARDDDGEDVESLEYVHLNGQVIRSGGQE